MKRRCLTFVLTAMLTLSAVVCGGPGDRFVVKAASQNDASVLTGDETTVQSD